MASTKWCMFLLVASVCVSQSCALNTVKEVIVDSYIGRWYQTHSNLFADFFADISDAECTTATYGPINETHVTVFNAYKTRTGLSDELSGYAYIADVTEPGKILVSLDGVPIDSPYWILRLGPMFNNQYEYSLISDSAGLSLFVLARDVPRFEKLYESEVEEYLSLTGFTGRKAPIKEYHGADCEYPPFPLPTKI